MPKTEAPVNVTLAAAAPGRILIAIGPFCWGKGRTAREALNNAKKNLPRSCSQRSGVLFSFYDAPFDAHLNDMGQMCWKEGDEPKLLGSFRSK